MPNLYFWGFIENESNIITDETRTIYRQSNSKFLCFCNKQFETTNGFHHHYRRNNCEDTSSVQASIHENPEDTENLANMSETSLSQVKNIEVPDNPLDTVSFASGVSERIKLLTTRSFDVFDNCFKKMKEDKKWKLRSERVVEDILYSYGSDLERENLFTDDEWAEITSEGNKKDVALSEEIRSLLEGMNKPTVNEIRKEIFKYADIRYNNYSKDKSFHIDKICYAIETLMNHGIIAIYGPHLSIASMILIALIANGPASTYSRKRKRATQDEFDREETGSKLDMSICLVSDGSKILEFGACEAASFYGGPTDRKYFHESKIKLPKMLKDMLLNLCEYSDWDIEKMKYIEVVGCVQSGGMIFATAGMYVADYLEEKKPANELEKQELELMSPIVVVDHQKNIK
ncbi:uncharacterized protein BX663DRAFT_557997 [Cokeromyces recurvatus]|uniref:uncharacterized protein n=1 Tax=Cokeromyces recurvatus TaxID=90255 RepID=UPI00221E8D0F|nr:uncharacterized protein BX663DRAFT_557997 [Cokeromyces recurvatus]KAI7906311.1 hypothetical protein BX663DRAFT_557997 [Cokeromyces recurvatus]